MTYRTRKHETPKDSSERFVWDSESEVDVIEPMARNYSPEEVRDEQGRWSAGGELSEALSSHVYDSHSVSESEKKLLISEIAIRTTSKERLHRVFSTNPKWNVGEEITLPPTSFTGINIPKGRSAGHIGWKDSDEALAVIDNPKRGLDVDYSKLNNKAGQVSPSEEDETVLAGRYRVVKIKKIPVPGTAKDSGWGSVRQYVLEEI